MIKPLSLALNPVFNLILLIIAENRMFIGLILMALVAPWMSSPIYVQGTIVRATIVRMHNEKC